MHGERVCASRSHKGSNYGFTLVYVTGSTTVFNKATEDNIILDRMAQNLILSHMNSNLTLILEGSITSYDMWKALLNRFEGNDQMKRTKLMGLEQQLENFRMIEGESVDEMYTRMSHIRNGFTALVESLTNSRSVGKLIGQCQQSENLFALHLN